MGTTVKIQNSFQGVVKVQVQPSVQQFVLRKLQASLTATLGKPSLRLSSAWTPMPCPEVTH